MRGVRAAVHAGRGIRPARPAGDPRRARRAGARAPERRPATMQTARRLAVDVDQRIVSGRRGQPAVGLVGQLRGRRHDPRGAGDRRDRFHERPVHAPPEGDLHRRRHAVSGGAARLRGAQGVRPRDRLRLLHRRDHLHAGDDPRHVRKRRRPRADDRRALRATAKSTSSRASSASRRSSSTRTRTSARASSTCPSSRCTRRRTG